MTHRSILAAGFRFQIEHVRRGRLIDRFEVANMMPEQGRNHVLGVLLKGAAQTLTWYIAPYSGNYTPQDTDTAATFPGQAGEFTGYSESTRVAFVPGTVSGGAVDNSGSVATITSNQVSQQTVRGASLVSASTKGSTSGIILSAIRFPSPKLLDNGDLLKFIAGFQLLNLS